MRKRKKKWDPKKKIGSIIYPRVSDPRQVENTSLEMQRKECERLSQQLEAPVIGVFEERGESAKTADRTQLHLALKLCVERQDEIRYFLVYRLDRFSRCTKDYLALKYELVKLGIELRAVIGHTEDSPEGRFSEIVQVAMAEWENEIRSLRTKSGMVEKARSGRWMHRAPLGYLQGQKGQGPSLILDPLRAPLLRKAFELVAQGGRSVPDVLEEVSLLGLRTRRGKKLDHRKLRKMLRNPVYTGDVKTFGVHVRGDFDPIVSQALFLQAQAVLDGRGYVATPHKLDNPDFPLRRFAWCAWCETPMTGSPTTKKLKNGRVTVRHYYRCRNSDCDGGGKGRVNVRRDAMESRFADHLAKLSAPKSLARAFAEIVRDVLRDRGRATQSARQSIARRRSELLDRRAAITEAVISGAIDPETSREQLDQNRAEDAELVRMEAELERPLPDVASLLPLAERVLTDPAGLWREASGEARLALQRFLFPEGVPFDGESFGTAVTSPLFSRLRAWEGAKGKMVTRRGFEPLSPG